MPHVAGLPARGHGRSIFSLLLETPNLERVLCRTDQTLTRQRARSARGSAPTERSRGSASWSTPRRCGLRGTAAGCSWMRSWGLPTLSPISSSTLVSKETSSYSQGFSDLVHIYHTELFPSGLMSSLGWKRDRGPHRKGLQQVNSKPSPDKGPCRFHETFHTPADVSVGAFLSHEHGDLREQAGRNQDSLGLKPHRGQRTPTADASYKERQTDWEGVS